MFRIELSGRSPRVLSREELAATVEGRKALTATDDGPLGPCVLEWLSPAGVILRRHASASWPELRSQIPALLLEADASTGP